MSNIIDNILNKTTAFLGRPSNPSVLGIDIGSSSIKVVQIQKKNNRAVLQTYGEIALGPYANVEVGRATKLDPNKLSEALNDLLKESNTTTKESALSIPMSMSMVSVISLPDVNKKQLGQMVNMEARKYIPVPITEVAMDWFVIPEPEKEAADDRFLPKNMSQDTPPAQNKENAANQDAKKIETMIVAIHNDTLNDFSSVIKNSEINSSFFEIEMFSTARSVLDPSYPSPVMIIDIGAGATKVYITERGIVRLSHNVGRGSQDLTLNISRSMGIDVSYAEKLKRSYGSNDPDRDNKISELIDNIFNPIFSSANTIILDYQKKHNKTDSEIIMVGGGYLLSGIKEKAQKYFSVETEIGLPFDKLQTPAFLDPVLQKNGVMFAGAIGLALRMLQELG